MCRSRIKCLIFLFSFSSIPSHVPGSPVYVLLSLVFLEPSPLLSSAFKKPFGTTLSSDIHAGRCASVLFFPLTYFLSRLCPEPLFKSGAASATNSLSSSFIVISILEFMAGAFLPHVADFVTRIWICEELKTWMCDVNEAESSFKVWQNEKKEEADILIVVEIQKNPPGNLYHNFMVGFSSLLLQCLLHYSVRVYRKVLVLKFF